MYYKHSMTTSTERGEGLTNHTRVHKYGVSFKLIITIVFIKKSLAEYKQIFESQSCSNPI